jgi:hypothetical protein
MADQNKAIGLVYRLAYNVNVVAFKMAAGKAVRAGLTVECSYPNRYVTDPAAHFQRNAPDFVLVFSIAAECRWDKIPVRSLVHS